MRRHAKASFAQKICARLGAVGGIALAILVSSASLALAGEVHVLTSSFGAPGSGNGQLSLTEHSSLAVNQSSHDVYVADTGNKRVEEFTSAGAFVRTFGSFQQPAFVAIDNSGGTSQGDVYVGDIANETVSKFSAVGVAVGAWGAAGSISGFSSLSGIAVDSSGNLFVLDNEAHRYDQSGASLASFGVPRGTAPDGLAVDSEDNLYKADGSPQITKFTGTPRLSEPPGTNLGEPDTREDGAALAIDPSNDDLYVVQSGAGGFVNRFAVNCGQGCTPLEEFGFGEVSNPQGIAVDASNHHAYVANAESSEIGVFGTEEVAEPTASIDAPTAVQYSTAHASGTVNPKGHSTTCHFEYVTEAHFQAEGFASAQSTPCATGPGSGTADVSVEADLGGLELGTIYHLRLAARNAGGTTFSAEPNQTLTTKAVPAVPTVSIEPVTTFTGTTAKFVGHINPNAPGPAPQDPVFDVSWHFECTPQCESVESFASPVAGDNQSHEVSVEATGLQAGTPYEVQLVARNASNPAVPAGPVSFATPIILPSVDSTSIASVTSTEAKVVAEIRPGGAPTTYHVEYVTQAHFEAEGFAGAQITPESESIGADSESHEITAEIDRLAPSTTYDVRAVAHNEVGTETGPAEVFTTYPSEQMTSNCPNESLRQENSSLGLPDCRALEQVSPTGNAPVYQQQYFSSGNPGGIVQSELAVRASASGDAVAYIGSPPTSGQGEGTGNSGGGLGDQYLAERGGGGWEATDVSPRGSSAGTIYEDFSEDLSEGVIVPHAGEIFAQGVDAQCTPYRHSFLDWRYQAFYTGKAPGECGDLHPTFVGASGDRAHLVFENKAALTDGAEEAPSEQFENQGHENVYDSFGGQVYLVNVLPGGVADPDATVGALVAEAEPAGAGFTRLPPINASNVVSRDGSRVFWTDLQTGIVYVRENGTQPPSAESVGHCTEPEKACTVQVSAGEAIYQTASRGGRFAYYTENGQLWRFDVNSESREALTGSNAGVLGVIGTNRSGEEGSYLYFVAEAALASNKVENGAGEEEAQAGQPNLYVQHEGVTEFVTTLLPSDNEIGVLFQGSFGDWRPILGRRSAQPSADGSDLVFMSTRRLTAYDNEAPEDGCRENACPEIYVYDSNSGRVSCTSCNPANFPPRKTASELQPPQTFLPPDGYSITHMHRFISDDGNRVVFQSSQQLAAADTNGEQDVYEWEREGVGSCTHASAINEGCVYLISGSKPQATSTIIEMSASGNDIFFDSFAQLTPSDQDDKPDLYDARAGGGFAPDVGTVSCETPEACHGAAAAPPVTSSPGSASFQANESPPPLPTCRKNTVRRKGKCVRKTRSKHHRKRGSKTKHRPAERNGGAGR